MSHINFEIPVIVSELLKENYDHYYIREVIGVKQLPGKLKEAKALLKEEGVSYIVDYFDTFISVILNKAQLSRDVPIAAFEDLHQAMKELNRSTTFVLSDKDVLTDEEKLKYVTIVKMIIYAYVNMTITVTSRETSTIPSKKSKTNDDSSKINKKKVLHQINTVLQQEISYFWDPPVVEESLINQIAEVCYNFLENPSIKSDKELCTDIFDVFGSLLTDYRYNTRFVHRMAELLKSYEHAVPAISEGIRILVESYNAKSLVRKFVMQITEWQTDERYQNAQATRNCAHVLSEMAKLMPEFMLDEVMYLTKYLSHESYTLRNSVLNVITEVILTALSKPELSREQQESKDDFLEILTDHMIDVSAFVRAKVIQHWCHLQEENILTVGMQTEVLEKVARHLRDKGSNVRKSAAGCVRSFLEHNPFGAELELGQMQEILKNTKQEYDKLKEKLCEPHIQKVKEAEEAWNQIKDDIAQLIANNSSENEDDQNNQEFDIPEDQIANIVQMYLREKKYQDAFTLTKKAARNIETYAKLRETMESDNENDFLLKLMHGFYIDVHNQLLQLMSNNNEDSQNIEKQQELINYYENAVRFLKVIEGAIEPMKDLLDSVNISEMHEAVDFFVTIYKFNIDNALFGILEMLGIMQRPEQDRKLSVTNALKTIFLETNAKSMTEHSTIIFDRLIKFMSIIPFDKVDNFKAVIFSWVTEGKLDNNIIDCAFQYFVKKRDVTDDISLKALQLLTLIAPAKRAIVTKNLRMITELVFEKRGVKDMIFLSETCKLIIAGTAERQMITDKRPPFKLKASDPMWEHLVNILCNSFDNKIDFYNPALKNGIRLIYTLCSKPDEICETIVKNVMKKLTIWNYQGTKEMKCFILIRFCVLLSEIAVCQLSFLDETIYKEIKRRLYIATEQANTKHKRKPNADFGTASLSKKKNTTDSIVSTTDNGDDSVLEGAQADDAEADFILDVLEKKIVTSSTSLGAFAPFLLEICENPGKFDDECLQCVAVLALLRYMLTSSTFCSSYIRLIFTILERSKYPEVKCTILINASDLLERFPNVIEPWSLQLYNRLNDADLKVQKTTFHILASLLLRDMLRVKSHIAYMAIFISKESKDLSSMSKNFFNALAIKDNHLYNVLPDIFSHLITTETVNEDQFRYIMKYLVGLITSAKHTESLVDRFCIKFNGTEDEYVCRNIAYCLSLLQYNEKAVKKFSDNFNYYKHILHNSDVYTFVKLIINSWNKLVKGDIKAVITELENNINNLFQIREDGDADPNGKPAPIFKKPKGKPIRQNKKKRIRPRSNSDSDDEVFNDTNSSISTPGPRRSNRSTRTNNRSIADDDSDD